MAVVRLSGIRKSYANHVALRGIDVEIASGAFFTLLGPSGCGKTTLLRVIAGFHPQDGGELWVDGQAFGHLPAHQRQVGMVFQDYAVFPHLSVFDNVAFGLVQQKVSSAQIKSRVQAILETMQLADLAQRMPHQLSGGQQQRVGLARALVIRPKLLLMDEPLSNLDAKLRVDLRRDIRQLQQEFGITTIYVTHDQEEALSLSDQVCVMYNGVVQQVGTPWDIYNQPSNRFVASFVGSNNFLPISTAGHQTRVLGHPIKVPQSVAHSAQSVAALRPEKVIVNPAQGQEHLTIIHTVLRQTMFTGRELALTLEVDGHGTLEALSAPSAEMIALRPGSSVAIGIRDTDLLYFAAGETGVRLQ